MSATAMSGGESTAEEETAACCDCCGLVEECTAAYEARVRERYGGRWICGLCGEAVEEELLRSAPDISADEALARHATFCRAFRSAAPPPAPLDGAADHLIAALRHLLRRSLLSPRLVRSSPSSPARTRAAASSSASASAAAASAAAALARTESCFPTLAG